MEQQHYAQNLIRKLNSRERRRLNVHNLIPVDAIDPTCSTHELIENKTTHLYRYGCSSLNDVNIEIENNSLRRKENPILYIQGSFHIIVSSLIFIYIILASSFFSLLFSSLFPLCLTAVSAIITLLS